MQQKPKSPTKEDLDRLFIKIEAHIEEWADFDQSDIAALDEAAKVFKAIKAVRVAGSWIWALAVKFGAFLIKAGAILTAALYLYEKIRSGLGK